VIAPYLSEIKYLGSGSVDFVEVAVAAGQSVGNIQVVIYHPNGTVRSTNSLGSVVSTISGRDVYVIDSATSATFNGVHANGAIALVVNGTVTSFVSFTGTLSPTVGPAAGMTSTAVGTTGGGQSLESTNGTSYTVQSTPNSGAIPCFAAGSRILTPSGECAVETLTAGDQVITADSGAIPVRWVGARHLTRRECMSTGALPVQIDAGALGDGRPLTPLTVSPNHCIVVRGSQCELLFGATEVLVPAKALVGFPGFRNVLPRGGIQYYHLLFDRHEVITANGLPSESFFPSHIGLSGLDADDIGQITEALRQSGLTSDSYGASARPILKPFEAAVLNLQTIRESDVEPGLAASA